MRRMRIALIVFFIAVTAVFAYVKVTGALDSDSEAPVITADSEELTVSVDATDEDLLAGMKASDNRDGDVTSSLVVVSRSKFIKTGVVNVNYAAFDSHNNVGTYTRRVTYEDYTSPTFSLSAPLVFRTGVENPNYLANVKATDVLDGDITSLIRMSVGTPLTNDDGTSTTPLTLQVTNTAGDTVTAELELQYVDDDTYSESAPGLSQYLVYTAVGQGVDAASYIDGILSGTTKRSMDDTMFTTEDISIDDSAVDYNTPGTYQIHYTLHSTTDSTITDPYGAETSETETLGTTTMFVVVKES